MKTIVLFLLLLIFMPFPANAVNTPQNSALTPISIKTEVAEHGPWSVVDKLYSEQSSWTYLMEQISFGEKAWLEVAVLLCPGSDAGTASELREAVSLALINNPENVLRVAVPTYELPLVCSGRADPLPTYELAISELEKQIESVRAIQDHSLITLRDKCLSELELSKPHLLSFFGIHQN